MSPVLHFADFVRGLRGVRPALVDSLIILERVHSTNDYGRQLLELVPADARPASILIVAYQQTRGRGREGRDWWSPAGAGLYASLLVEVASNAQVQTLPLAVGVGLCTALGEAGVECGLKWPNDLVVDGRKLGGMLIEVITPGEGAAVAIVGFGINLGGEREKLDQLDATSIENLVTDSPDLVGLATGVVKGLLGALERMDATEALVNEYRRLVVHRKGDELTWKQDGARVRGRYAGIDERGFLRLDTDTGMVVVSAGEVVSS